MEEGLRIGALVRDLRKRQQMTQEELAERTGRSVDAISLIERDVTSPTVSTLLRIVSALGLTAAEFFRFTEEVADERRRLVMVAVVELEKLNDRNLDIAVRQLRAFNE